MPVNSAAIILSKLPSELPGDVASRIAMMEQTPPEVVASRRADARKKVANVLSQEMTQAGGPKALVDLLNRVDRQTERLILEALEDEQPDLAEQIKNMMFVFETSFNSTIARSKPSSARWI